MAQRLRQCNYEMLIIMSCSNLKLWDILSRNEVHLERRFVCALWIYVKICTVKRRLLNVVVLKLERCVFEMYTLQFALVVMEYALSLMKCATFKEL